MHDAPKMILCYDICDEKRLQKIGRRTERFALRIQRSVYFIEKLMPSELANALEAILPILNPDEDDLRIYTHHGSNHCITSGMDLDNTLMVKPL